jgi:FAD/FMN-containing dehydrogenase
MSPELRAGNASLRAQGGETLEAVQLAAAAAGQFLPVDADGSLTVSELLQRRDGGPIEACYGRLRDRVLAAGIAGLSLGSEAVKDVAGYDLRRMLLGSAPVEWAVFRLARLPERRERLLARGGDAFSLAEILRADAAEPAALVVLETGLLAIAEDCGAEEGTRRRDRLTRCARETGAELEELDEAGWLAVCAGLPSGAVRMASREARVALPAHAGPWAYDAGRRLALVAPGARAALAPARPASPASAGLAAAVVAAAVGA